jgi:hypothetical protein
MIATESTALSISPGHTPTPTRRASWKKSDIYNVSRLSFNEKHTPASNNPFSHPYSTPPTTPSPLSLKDIEALDSLPYRPKPKRTKFGLCVLVISILVMWALFVYGAVLLMDTVFPGALRYDKIRELKVEMIDTEAAVSMLKSQVGGLYRYIEGLSVLNGPRGYENATMEVGLGEGLSMEAMSGMM